jgi:hypothetical protein
MTTCEFIAEYSKPDQLVSMPFPTLAGARAEVASAVEAGWGDARIWRVVTVVTKAAVEL